MTTANKTTVDISATVPECVLTALEKRQGQYTEMVSVFHCLQVGLHHWIGVAGDGDNGSYEAFSFENGELTCTDVGYGSTLVAFREILDQKNVGSW